MAKNNSIAEVKSAASARKTIDISGPMDFSTENLGSPKSEKKVANALSYDLPSPIFPDFSGEDAGPREDSDALVQINIK